MKFFGEGSNRVLRTHRVVDEVERSGCHWACTYPSDRRPRQVRDGDVLYLARLVRQPNDVMVFGRAIGLRHIEGRDDASDADKALRPWKAKWPYYVRVHNAEFVAGTLGHGISLYALMEALQADGFVTTREHALAGRGNTNPRRAYMQQPAVRLTAEGAVWLGVRLEEAFRRYGTLQNGTLNALDWPEEPPGLTAPAG